MQKLIKNWIFTLVTCILLAILSVLMFLDGAGVGDLFIGQRIIHVLTAVSLLIYVILALCPMVPKYHTRSGRSFLLIEIVVLIVTAIAQIGVELFNDIPWISDLAVCSVLGLALWLRAFVLIVRAYLVQGIVMPAPKEGESAPVAENVEAPILPEAELEAKEDGDEKKKTLKALVRTPLWKLCIYILIASVGVWQMVRPLIEDRYFVFCIAAVAAVFAVIFGVWTAQNHKALPQKPKEPKEPKEEKKTEDPAVAAEPVAVLPEPAAPAETPEPAEEPAAKEQETPTEEKGPLAESASADEG